MIDTTSAQFAGPMASPAGSVASAAPIHDRHVIAVAGPRAGQHGTASAAGLRRSSLITVTTDPPRPVPAGCEVSWDDGTTAGYPVTWLRAEPFAA